MTCSNSPSVSTRTWRFLPLIFFRHRSPPVRPRPPVFRALHALAVDDRGRRAGLAASQFSALYIERVVDAIESAIGLPAQEVIVHRAARRKIGRNRRPLTPGSQNIHDTVDNCAFRDSALVATLLRWRDQRPDDRPLFVSQIARIAQLTAIIASTIFRRPPPTAPANRPTTIES